MPAMTPVPDGAEVYHLPDLARSGWELATWGIIGVVAIVGFWIWVDSRSRDTRTRMQDLSDMLAAIKQSTDAARAELCNDHSPDQNMRDQLDQIERVVDGIQSQQAHQGRDIRGLREEVGGLRGEVRENHDGMRGIHQRVDGLETDWRADRAAIHRRISGCKGDQT